MIIALPALTQNSFEKKVHVKNSDTLPYNLLIPKEFADSFNDGREKALEEKKFPLVLFLHGAGERGTDNEKQIGHIKKLFIDSANREKYQVFVVAPQCPEGKKWVEVDWSAKSHIIPTEPSWAMSNAISLIEDIIENYPVDTTRIYVTGLSMGGYGTWDVISRYPEKFAAAIAICGGGDEKMAKKIKNIPIWAFHGSNDKVVPVSRSRNMINAIKMAGGNPKYTEYKGVGHGSWINAYNEKLLLDWLFEQKK
ncbi:MAG: prolyl oligopeptidase family serine peptidase [Chloroflexia bacterium]|nr:prolyl oligopeptidase family serine peptidase [Chloroflexia bacterium]